MQNYFALRNFYGQFDEQGMVFCCHGHYVRIACLGLLGLSTFLAEQKTKEIGIRKVLGASGYGEFNRLIIRKIFSSWWDYGLDHRDSHCMVFTHGLVD